MRFDLIGAGMGTPDMLTAQARAAIERADAVVGTQRLAEGLSGIRPDIRAVGFAQLASAALESGGRTAILLSGDTGFFSAAKKLRETLAPQGEVRLLPGMSSLQVFCAKIGASYDDAVLCSVHGREADAVLGMVSYHANVIALTGGKHRAHDVCRTLARSGLRHVRVTVGENLGAPEERIVSGTPEQLIEMEFDDLCIMQVCNDRPADASHALRDADFVRGEVPMTKQEVRWLACDLLSVRPTDVVYDIGAGTGSVTMELARRACHGQVYAIECKADALELIARNRVHTGNYHVQIVEATAPDGLEALPTPDCVFIGGSRGHMGDIIRALLVRNPHVRIVLSAIALESVHDAIQSLTENGIQPEISCVNVSRARVVGPYHMMTAQNPVYLIGGNL